MVVCEKCAGVQKPGGAESNAAQDWIADLRSVLSTLDGGQYLTWRAATQYRDRNYATLPQTCNAGTGCQQAIDAPACPGHRWPLWGVYTVKKLLEDPTFAADFEIRQTARVYHLDGRGGLGHEADHHAPGRAEAAHLATRRVPGWGMGGPGGPGAGAASCGDRETPSMGAGAAGLDRRFDAVRN